MGKSGPNEMKNEDLNPVDLKFQESKTESLTVEEHFSKQQLEEIHRIFESAPRGGLKKAEFRSRVLAKYKIDISDDEYDTLFTRLDFMKNDQVSWEEFVTYLVLELEAKCRNATKSVSIENPIVDEPRIISSGHRSAIIQIAFSPSVRLNGTVDYDDGKYVSMSKDGFINFWSLDLKLMRTYRDKSLYPSIRGTWVVNFACLPDVNVFVTSSTEREMRFYDTTSKRFNLIIVFVSMPFCVNHMFYYFSENPKEESILVCGDLGGNIRVIQFPKEDKGPFKQKIGVEILVLKWDSVVKGKLPGMKAFNILNVHADWVRQVSYYKLLGSIVSCSTSPNAMFVGDYHGSRTSYMFFLKRGIETFCLSEDSPLIVTGSLDCILRLWNPFITNKPISLLRGHHASIVKIFLQDGGRKIFSLDKHRLLKVWESSSQTCLQTYSGFAFESGPMEEFSAYYNEKNQAFLVGGFKIATTTCGRLVDELRTDGKTHCGPVSIVLYNRLFKSVITCGLDSNIVLWDLWTNSSKACIRKAHSKVVMGILMPLPITAATLDPPHQYLLTGSSDGTIKMWDFELGICLRNMDVGKNNEVTKLIWIKNRILAVGWNCRVVEFADSLAGKVFVGKPWELRHTSDILAADYRPGQALATGTYNGDLIFWRLETGQSYKRYNVTYPMGLFKLEYMKEKTEKKDDFDNASSKSSKNSSRGRKDRNLVLGTQIANEHSKHSFGMKVLGPTNRNILAEKAIPSTERNLAIYCLIFLRKREMLPDQGTLLTATENGMIQVWSHHPSGSYITAFKAVHVDKDYVVSMQTDSENEFLFTGTVMGYIKVWLMKNYCLCPGSNVSVSMPKYRLQFPFLINDRIITRAKAILKIQPLPLLLSSYRGHIGAVLHLEYIEESKLLLTASADKTVRVWTLSGRYIGCLGQNKPWLNLSWGVEPEKINAPGDFRIPPDLVRSGSYTTLKVFKGAPPIATKKYDVEVDLNISEEEKKLGVFGRRLESPYLGKNHGFPQKLSRKKKLPPLDETTNNIPVFRHVLMTSWKPISRTSTPECIREIVAKTKKDASNEDSQSDN